MADCFVRCFDCDPVRGGPRTWRWLCEDCATEQRDDHMAQTGHCDVQLSIVEKPTMADVLSTIRRVHRITGGW